MDDDKLIESVSYIKEYCKSQTHGCKDCILGCGSRVCSLMNVWHPDLWDIEAIINNIKRDKTMEGE